MKNKPGNPRKGICSPIDPCHLTIIIDDKDQPTFGCAHGGGDCTACVVVEAEVSDFHDRTLSNATTKIRKVLEGIPPDSRGRKLSFITTSMGFLLAWVEHGAVVPPGAKVLTQQNIGEEAFLKELKVKSAKK